MYSKTIKSIVLALVFSNVLYAQDSLTKQTLLSGKINKIGLIGSFSGGYSSINQTFTPTIGGSASLLFNEKFAVGLGGYHFVDKSATSTTNTHGGVGGLRLEYITRPSKLVHVSFPLLLGMGRFSYDSLGYDEYRGSKGHGGRFSFGDFDNDRNGARFAVIQPGVNVEVNVFKYLTLFGGANYRIALNSNSTTYTNSKLSGVGFQVGLKAGLFGVPIRKKNS